MRHFHWKNCFGFIQTAMSKKSSIESGRLWLTATVFFTALRDNSFAIS